jgi:nucleotide-binding universal stress UspA family protein
VFRRILVGFDGSRDAREALRTGIAMASAAQGEVAVLIVASASHGETDEDRRAAFDAESAPLRSSAEHELQAAIRSAATGSVHAVAGDRPADVLSSYVDERGFDLLVVGRHGRERAAHRGLGRVARDLAERARCPVLLIGDGNPDGEG